MRLKKVGLTPRWLPCPCCLGVLPPGAWPCLWVLPPGWLWRWPRPSELWPGLFAFCRGVLLCRGVLFWLACCISTSWNPPPFRRARSGGPPFCVRLSRGVGVAWTRIALGLSSAEAPFPISCTPSRPEHTTLLPLSSIYKTSNCPTYELGDLKSKRFSKLNDCWGPHPSKWILLILMATRSATANYLPLWTR